MGFKFSQNIDIILDVIMIYEINANLNMMFEVRSLLIVLHIFERNLILLKKIVN